MPFAKKFLKHMKFPKEGEKINEFTLESIKVEHIGMGSGKYEYPTELVVFGKGGKKKVKEVFRKFFDQRITLFSGYGNPYQCHGGKMEIENLGERKYRIIARGNCTRIFLRMELYEFLQYLERNEYLSDRIVKTTEEKLIEEYIQVYHKKSKKTLKC